MHGLIVKLTARPGQRDAMISILVHCVQNMPGSMSYIVAKDPADENAIWATEVWDSEASHDASFTLPAVKAAVEQVKPMVVGVQSKVVTQPVSGYGLQRDSKAQ
jgi:quinol monooxygenase YgiN